MFTSMQKVAVLLW